MRKYSGNTTPILLAVSMPDHTSKDFDQALSWARDLEANEGFRAVLARKDVRHASAEEIEQALRG